MANELILRILVCLYGQEQADNAFQFIHNHWMLTREGWDLALTMVEFNILISKLDRPNDTRVFKWLKNWEKELM